MTALLIFGGLSTTFLVLVMFTDTFDFLIKKEEE